jgi:hypothetical protein
MGRILMEKLIELLIEKSYHKYRKLGSSCYEGSMLTRKIPVEIDGIVFTGWYEYVCYKVCEYIKDKIPEAEIELVLDGNDSSVSLAVNEKEESILSAKIINLIEEWKE